jgi:hypothetical protein
MSYADLDIDFGKVYHKRFLAQERALEMQQEAVQAQKLKDKEIRAQAKILRESQEQVSYFSVVYTLQTITTAKKLDAALATIGSAMKKVEFLKLFIKMYAIGFGYDISTQFSSTKDKEMGKLTDLLKRAQDILKAKYRIPERPPARKAKQSSSPEDFGLTRLPQWEDCVAQYDVKVGLSVNDVLELENTYGVRLIYDYDSIQRQQWDVPLTPLHKEFRRGRVFREAGSEFEVVGLSWDTKKNEYYAYYHRADCKPERVNDPEGRVEFSFFVSTESFEGINDWQLEWLS